MLIDRELCLADQHLAEIHLLHHHGILEHGVQIWVDLTAKALTASSSSPASRASAESTSAHSARCKQIVLFLSRRPFSAITAKVEQSNWNLEANSQWVLHDIGMCKL